MLCPFPWFSFSKKIKQKNTVKRARVVRVEKGRRIAVIVTLGRNVFTRLQELLMVELSAMMTYIKVFKCLEGLFIRIDNRSFGQFNHSLVLFLGNSH